ncbi:MAG: hypothetical protein KGH81_05310 [Thaumarchaeota archaeon]|nr:hypothetical protein [Nitrososphaerota archaeon]MDE1841859.1 hypothetical protein [Nitrososphaerota archaeon]MDE1878181.1 hypothetical protein [Nitrososphaerota archaeon]
MKTIHLSIIVAISIILFIMGNTTNSFASNFESVKQPYLSLINATELNLVITNSSEFKEKIQGYHYNFLTAIARLGFKQDNSFTLGSVDVVYSLYAQSKIPWDKTIVITTDSKSKILGIMEYHPWNVPLGYPLPIVPSHLYTQDNYTTNIDINKLVNVMPPSPLEQIKHGVAIKDIDCFQGISNLELIFKAEDGSPACVTSNTANILIEHGWAKALQ